MSQKAAERERRSCLIAKSCSFAAIPAFPSTASLNHSQFHLFKVTLWVNRDDVTEKMTKESHEMFS